MWTFLCVLRSTWDDAYEVGVIVPGRTVKKTLSLEITQKIAPSPASGACSLSR